MGQLMGLPHGLPLSVLPGGGHDACGPAVTHFIPEGTWLPSVHTSIRFAM